MILVSMFFRVTGIMSIGWDDEDEASWRDRRRAARSSQSSAVGQLQNNSERVSFRYSGDNFGSNMTTSSVSSVRTKNTFLEIQDDLERLSLERIRSSRSRSLPPHPDRETIEDLQVRMASFYLDQLANLKIGQTEPPKDPKKKKKKKPIVVEENEKQSRLFVGGLSEVSNDESLRAHFSMYGDLVEATVILDKRSKHSRGFGFVAFRDGVIPVNVLTDNHVIDGTVVGVRLYGSAP